MLDDIVNALHACRSEREFWRVHIKAENALTPIEVAALIKFSHRLPDASQLWLEGLASLGNFAAAEPPRFCRQPLAPHIDLYRDPFVPSERKQLIFGFCGAANRLMMPISCVLQYLSADTCDLVLLRDPAKLHYVYGIPPYAGSVASLAVRLRADFAAEPYRRIVCYGTSMGGFVALQCGILMRADAAISIGGRFAWHPPRLLANRLRPFPASIRFAPATPPPRPSSSATTAPITSMSRTPPCCRASCPCGASPCRKPPSTTSSSPCATRAGSRTSMPMCSSFPQHARVFERPARRSPPSRALRRALGAPPVLPVLQAPIRVRRRRGRTLRSWASCLRVRTDPCGR